MYKWPLIIIIVVIIVSAFMRCTTLAKLNLRINKMNLDTCGPMTN